MNFPGPTREEIKYRLKNIDEGIPTTPIFLRIGKLGDIELLEYFIKTNPKFLKYSEYLNIEILYSIGRTFDYKSLKYLLENHKEFKSIANRNFFTALFRSENKDFSYEILEKYPSKASTVLSALTTAHSGTSEMLKYVLDNHLKSISMRSLKAAWNRLHGLSSTFRDLTSREARDIIEEAIKRKKSQ